MTDDPGRTAIITIAKDRRDHLARQRAALVHHAPDVPHVVVDMGGPDIEPAHGLTIVPLASPDGAPLPLARARNLGALHAGDVSVLVFLDVDCIPGERLVERYVDVGMRVGGIGCGPVGYLPPSSTITDWSEAALREVAHVQPGRPAFGQPLRASRRYDLFWSLSFAIDRRSWDLVGGFDERFVGYGGEDTDFARTARDHGIGLHFLGDAPAFHQHHPVSSPPYEHLADIAFNARRFHEKWHEWPMQGWLRRFAAEGLIEWQPGRGVLELHHA